MVDVYKRQLSVWTTEVFKTALFITRQLVQLSVCELCLAVYIESQAPVDLAKDNCCCHG